MWFLFLFCFCVCGLEFHEKCFLFLKWNHAVIGRKGCFPLLQTSCKSCSKIKQKLLIRFVLTRIFGTTSEGGPLWSSVRLVELVELVWLEMSFHFLSKSCPCLTGWSGVMEITQYFYFILVLFSLAITRCSGMLVAKWFHSTFKLQVWPKLSIM